MNSLSYVYDYFMFKKRCWQSLDFVQNSNDCNFMLSQYYAPHELSSDESPSRYAWGNLRYYIVSHINLLEKYLIKLKLII